MLIVNLVIIFIDRGAKSLHSHLPVWERACILRFSARLKLLSHLKQWCGFSLVCVLTWTSILYLVNQT